MRNIYVKILSVAMILGLVLNLFYLGTGRITDFIFWLNLGVLGIISFIMFGDKSFLKNMFKKN